jgi:hypothetical protein
MKNTPTQLHAIIAEKILPVVSSAPTFNDVDKVLSNRGQRQWSCGHL